ncbi:MAG: hypothetical protein ISR51_05245 [Rhodospirillales bacterium]|nr:hypothetical protein [Alphaproteobacteria bacterium]MBL6948064.1 hypothetical protein [Rhodospirillales bacterium]
MMKNYRGPAPLPPPNRCSWFGARLHVAGTHCRLADLTVRLLTVLGPERQTGGTSPPRVDNAHKKGMCVKTA